MTTTNKHRTGDKERTSSRSGDITTLLWAGLVVIITFFALSPVMDNSFINQDDNLYIFDNKDLDKPLSEAIPHFFGAHYYSGNYVPITMIGYALAYRISGPTPETFHKVSLFFHLLNVLAVFWFAYLLSGRKSLVAAVTALIFGVHPMHVESVAWASELKDLLYTLFFVTGLGFYYQYVQRNDNKQGLKFPIVAFVLFLLSLLCKPAAVIFPLAMLAIDLYTSRKPDKQLWLEQLPFFAVSIIFGVIAIIAQRADHLINDQYPLIQRLVFACYGLILYVVKFFAPVHLSTFYPYPAGAGGSPALWLYAMPVALATLCFGVYRFARGSRVILFGALFFAINLLLVLQVLTVGNAVIADRYTYVPYIGLAFIVAMGFDHLCDNANAKLAAYKYPAAAVVAVACMACAYGSYARAKIWQNQYTIAEDILEKFPDDPFALNNMGYLLIYQGRNEDAIPLLKKAIACRPGYVMAYTNLANAYIATRQWDAALGITDQVLATEPNNSGLLTKKGFLLFAKGDNAGAVSYFDKALAIKPGDMDVYLNLLRCYDATHDHDNWVKTLDAALSYDPNNYLLLNNKGYDLFTRGHYSEAVTYLKASLEKNPDNAIARNNLENCYKAMNAQNNTTTSPGE